MYLVIPAGAGGFKIREEDGKGNQIRTLPGIHATEVDAREAIAELGKPKTKAQLEKEADAKVKADKEVADKAEADAAVDAEVSPEAEEEVADEAETSEAKPKKKTK